jgi:meso-butanediol dehydrogenase / (S,S)-butanediol dehydrogenase / diacetyl reductase
MAPLGAFARLQDNDGRGMDARFEGRVVVVIDRGSGVGAATARRFAVEGASVLIAGATRDVLDQVEAFDPALDSVGDTMGRITAWCTDVADESAITALLEDVVGRWGRLDVLVNAGGVPLGGGVETTTPQLWRESLSLELDATFYASHAALGHLRRTRGAIVNVAALTPSTGRQRSVGSTVAYAGAVNLTRTMALDHGREGVRINVVCPSLRGRDQRHVPEGPSGTTTNGSSGQNPPHWDPRAAEPSEVADVIVFLASEDARFVNGVSLPVDGGFTSITDHVPTPK